VSRGRVLGELAAEPFGGVEVPALLHLHEDIAEAAEVIAHQRVEAIALVLADPRGAAGRHAANVGGREARLKAFGRPSLGPHIAPGVAPRPFFALQRDPQNAGTRSTSGFRQTRLLGSLWNPDLQARLQRIHERLERQAAAGARAAKSPPPQFKRRRMGAIGDVIAAVLTEHPSGLRVREIAAAAAARLDDSISESTVKTCLWREARRTSGRFERIGRGCYRLRS
jgi:hypothetical protein